MQTLLWVPCVYEKRANTFFLQLWYQMRSVKCFFMYQPLEIVSWRLMLLSSSHIPEQNRPNSPWRLGVDSDLSLSSFLQPWKPDKSSSCLTCHSVKLQGLLGTHKPAGLYMATSYELGGKIRTLSPAPGAWLAMEGVDWKAAPATSP